MLISSSSFTALTGQAAPVSFSTLEARVVARLGALLSRDLSEYNSETVPADLAEAIAWGVATLANPQAPAVPAGVSSVNIGGDYSTVMAFGFTTSADGTPLSLKFSVFADLGGRCVALALRHRRVAL